MKPAGFCGRVILFAMFVIFALIALPALAYQYLLSASDIRNAYLLGYAKDLNTTNFFAQYAREFPAPDSGPHVATITLKTPYAQVAELGHAAVNSDVQAAEEQFANKKFSLLVRVEVDLTATYPAPPVSNPANSDSLVPDFQNDFNIQLVQDGKKIDAQSTRVYLLNTEGVSHASQVTGAIIELKYDPDNVNPDEGVTVKVHTPDDQHLKATFDLSQLR
jgi:hypothetical protein